MTKIELGRHSPSEKRKTFEYQEGYDAFLSGASITENPHIGLEPEQDAWNWAYGWFDAQADKARNK